MLRLHREARAESLAHHDQSEFHFLCRIARRYHSGDCFAGKLHCFALNCERR
jgi:hypothetical protein